MASRLYCLDLGAMIAEGPTADRAVGADSWPALTMDFDLDAFFSFLNAALMKPFLLPEMSWANSMSPNLTLAIC
ncbi:MAG: hypothetical protein ABGY41_18380, partial [Candidatus Poribacteria bacterium]